MTTVGTNHKFKTWLQNEMNKRHWSQSDLARSAGLNRAVINKLLNGPSTPSHATLRGISRAFKVPFETVYRHAGLLPEIPDHESFIQEATHLLREIKSPQRKTTALNLIRTLEKEDEQENR